MNKYNKAMNKVKVTTDMHKRIMDNIQEIDFESNQKNIYSLKNYKKYISIAACLLLIITGSLLTKNINQESQIQVIPNIVEYNSKDELSSALGFEVNDVKNIPFDIESIKYTSYDNIAEIIYSGNNNSLIFRMAKESEDISGNYNNYDNTEIITINNIKVRVSRNAGQAYLANWNSNGFTYSLDINKGISIKDMEYTISSLLNK